MIIKDAGPISISGNNQREGSQEKLKKACADFESIFLSYMLKTMRAGVSGINPVGKSHETKMLYAISSVRLTIE